MKWINRHLYSILSGILLQSFLFREGIVHYAVMIVFTKLLMHTIDRKKQPWIIFVFVMAYSSMLLIYEIVYNYRSPAVGFTYYSVILNCKLSTLGFCYKDGAEVKDYYEAHELRCRIVEMPTFVELFSYS